MFERYEPVTMSAYDLLPEEDREALAWVREYGGLEAVEKRLMPDGMEWLIESWPRFDDNEPARWEDEYANGNGGVSPLHHVSLYADGRAMLGKGKVKVVLAPGERAKRPAPKVLDADGVEISVGDTVYPTGYDEPLTVKGFDNDGRVLMDYHNDDSLGYKPSKLTHEQPDTWERLEHDAEKTVCEYFGANYDCANCPLETARCAEEVKKDIIRRAKKLAEGGA